MACFLGVLNELRAESTFVESKVFSRKSKVGFGYFFDF